MTRLSCFAMTMVVVGAGCAGAPKVKAVPDPNRPVRVLGAGDPEVLSLAIVAGRDAVAIGQGRETLFLSGILFNRVEAKALGDSVAKAIGITRIGTGSGAKVPFAVAKIDGSGPVPRAVPGGVPLSVRFSFVSFRTIGDSAYVGLSRQTAPSGRADAQCVTMLRTQGALAVVSRRPIGNGEDCGK